MLINQSDFKDEKEKLLEFFESSASLSEQRHTEVNNHLSYYQGEHWTEQDRRWAKEEGLELVTVNQIFKFMVMLSGLERQQRTDARAFAVGRGSDPLVADLLSLAMKSIDVNSDAYFVRSDMYMHGQIAYTGYLGWNLAYSNQFPVIQQEAVDPREIFEDPEGTSYHFEGNHRFLIRRRWFDSDALVERYGFSEEDKKTLHGAIATSRFRNSRRYFRTVAKKKMAALFEYEWKEYEKVVWAVQPKTNQYLSNIDPKNLSEIKKLYDAGYYVHIDSKPKGKIARMVGDHLLEIQDHPLPDGKFMVSRYDPYFAMGQSVSMTKQLISQQNEVNANRTAMHELISRAPKGLIIYTKNSGVSKQALKDFSVLGTALEVNSIDEVKVLDAANFYNALGPFAQMAATASQEFQTITGITDVLLGQLKSSTSGVVFSRAVTQAAVGTQMALDNYQRTLLQHYKKSVPIIQKFFPVDKLLRVSSDQYEVLEKFAGGSFDGEDKDPREVVTNIAVSPVAGDGVSPAEIKFMNSYNEAINTINTDMGVGEFDVVMDFSKQSIVHMQANLAAAIELLRISPDITPHVMDLVVDMTDFSQKELWKERIREFQKNLTGRQDSAEAQQIMQAIQAQQAPASPRTL